MNLVFNELSFLPLADNEEVVADRFRQLLQAFDEAKKKYAFKHIRFPHHLHGYDIAANSTFTQFLGNLKSRTLKDAIIALFRPPYTDDLEEEELTAYYSWNYELTGEGAPATLPPVGLTVAYIKRLPAVSINSDKFWSNRKIQIKFSNDHETHLAVAYNICSVTDIESHELEEWAAHFLPDKIDSPEILKIYLQYSKYTVHFTDEFIEQFLNWKKTDFKTFKYILALMKDVHAYPFTGGMGQTENLKSRNKEASKRINYTDRLSYTLEKSVVRFIACKGHYDFH